MLHVHNAYTNPSTVGLNVSITVIEPPGDQSESDTVLVEQGRNVLVRCSFPGLEENDTIEWIRIMNEEEVPGEPSTSKKTNIFLKCPTLRNFLIILSMLIIQTTPRTYPLLVC